MAYLKYFTAAAFTLTLSAGANAQINTVVEAAPTLETEVVRAQYIREGDVSPEEYAALLAEADRVRAYQGHSTSYTGVSYDAVTEPAVQNNGYQIDIYDTPAPSTSYTETTYGTSSYEGSSYNVVTESVSAAPASQYPMAKTYPLGTDFSAPEFQADFGNTATTYASTPTVTYQAPTTHYSAPTPTYSSPSSTSHYVVKGDTLYNIAKRTGSSVTAIKSANGLSSNVISLGQSLVIPGTNRVVNVESYNYTAPVTAAATVVSQQPYSSSSRPTLVRNVEPLPNSSIYAVLPKDTLYSIARRACVSVADMRNVNGNLDPQTLQPGQRLTLPGGHCLR